MVVLLHRFAAPGAGVHIESGAAPAEVAHKEVEVAHREAEPAAAAPAEAAAPAAAAEEVCCVQINNPIQCMNLITVASLNSDSLMSN